MLSDGVLHSEDLTVKLSGKEAFIPSELKLVAPKQRMAWGYLSFAIF